MERKMAFDLTNWMFNMYIEVRHVSLEELGADESILKVPFVFFLLRVYYSLFSW